MTRVWPIAMIQMPTAIYMISGFMNSIRIIYLDGRPHTDPDVVVRSFNGESIGHWEGDTLVVDTRNFVDDHHWIDTGIPASDEFRMIERMRLIDKGANLEIEYTATDPKSWEGEWKWTKRFRRMDDTDITEASCLPDLNEHMPSIKAGAQRPLREEDHENFIGYVLTFALGIGLATSALRASLDERVRSRENDHHHRHRQAIQVGQSPFLDRSGGRQRQRRPRTLESGNDRPRHSRPRRLEIDHAETRRQGDIWGSTPWSMAISAASSSRSPSRTALP